MLIPIPKMYESESLFMVDFREGKEAALRFVFDVHGVFLGLFVKRIVESEPEVEDIVANCIYHLFHERNEMESFSNITEWLYSHLTKCCKDHLIFHKEDPIKAETKVTMARIQVRLLQFEFWDQQDFHWMLKNSNHVSS